MSQDHCGGPQNKCESENPSVPDNGETTAPMSFKDWKKTKEETSSMQIKPEKNKRNSGKKFSKRLSPPPSLYNFNFDQNVFDGSFSSDSNRGNFSPNFNRSDLNGSNFSGPNLNGPNLNRPNFIGHNLYGPNLKGHNFNDCGFNAPNLNARRGHNNLSLSDNFFNTDGFYRQRDMIEEAIADNPLRNNSRASQKTNVFKYTNTRPIEDKKKPANTSKPVRKENEAETVVKTEPTIFIKNPRKESNKPYVPMPKPPESQITGTIEERKRQWKDYREAMKPFKNREFHNAKRVVQRLGKKDQSELDEKQQFRLANAQEKIAQYKQHLAEKYDHYIQSPDDKNKETPGQLFILKRGSQPGQWSAGKPNPEQFQNYGNFGDSHLSNPTNVLGVHGYSGRKILGSKYSSFASGGTVESSITQM